MNELDLVFERIVGDLPALLRPLGQLYVDAFKSVPKDKVLGWLLDAVKDQTRVPAWRVVEKRLLEAMSVNELDQVMAVCNEAMANLNADQHAFDRSVELAIWDIALKGLALL